MAQYLDSGGNIANLFMEEIQKGLVDLLPGTDPVFKDIITTSESVVTDSVTKGWKVIWEFMTSLAGAFRYGNTDGPQMTGNTGRANIVSANSSYPGISAMVQPGLATYYLKMAKTYGNLAMNIDQFRAQSLSKTVDNYPAKVIEQTVKHMAHLEACSFYLDTSARLMSFDCSGGSLAQVGNAITIASSAAATVEVLDNGRIRRLKPGMQVDIWASDESVCYTQNGWAMISSSINYYETGTITLLFESNADANAFYALGIEAVDGLWLMPYSSIADKTADGTGLSLLPCGYQSWMLNSKAATAQTLFGSVFGNIDVTAYGSQLGSIVAAHGAALDENSLNKYLTMFGDANDFYLDTIITTGGVITKLLDDFGEGNVGTHAYIVREEGNAQDLALGWEKVTYVFNGRRYQILASPYIHSIGPVTGGGGAHVVITKLKDGNIKRYIPPALNELRGTGVADLGTGIEWLGLKTGPSAWLPAYSAGGAITNGVQAPFDLISQRAPTEPRGILLSTVTEDNISFD